jgi:hypothetical protein
VLVDGRRWREDRAGREDERGHWQQKNSSAATQQSTKKKGGKDVLVISVGGGGASGRWRREWEVAARQLTWRRQLHNCGGGSNDANNVEMITMQKQ